MTDRHACCSPARGPTGPAPQAASHAPQAASPAPCAPVRDADAVFIPAATALVGTAAPVIPDDGESPLRQVRLGAFHIARATVTNAEFARFVAATGYVTEAERLGWSFVFWQQVPPQTGITAAYPEAAWWRRVDGACWSAPHGPGSEAAARPDHPVVQVSWNDARAYAAWVGGRLPSEAEWEHAARGGRGDVPFPWGMDAPDDSRFLPCNIWQGQFPHHNTAADGHVTTAPARSFAANGYGLFHMVGNVWEWTADPFRIRSLKPRAKARMAAAAGYRTLKGGSFLCHRSYCYRYRIAARTGTSPDSATMHQGFRVVWPA